MAQTSLSRLIEINEIRKAFLNNALNSFIQIHKSEMERNASMASSNIS